MALADDLQTLRERVVTELTSAYDYYADTKSAWRIVHRSIATGHTFIVRNMTTGTITTHADLANRARGYIAKEVVESTFQQFISIFEGFYFELLRLWLTAYPQSLGKKTASFKSILELPDKAAIVDSVIRRELIEIVYDRPTEWFAYLNVKVQLGCPTPDEIEQIAEAKATRDIFVHNGGIANQMYQSKAGAKARFQPGQRMDIPEHYHRQTWELVHKLVLDLANAAIAKAT